MQPFVKLKGVAAPLPIVNIDTDMIVPAAFLKTVSRKGLGEALFHTMRYDDQNQERPDFILNKEPWRNSRIIIALENFGCGSSREHAPWALLDFGVRCVIASSFADIFYGNCFKNGILPLILPRADIDNLLERAADLERCSMEVDLVNQAITTSDGSVFSFEINAEKKTRLLKGLDDIAFSLGLEDAINKYEERMAKEQPWLRTSAFNL